MVNAIQRRADIVVQKSLVEGFGLTVSGGDVEGRPVVAFSAVVVSRPIDHGQSGWSRIPPTSKASRRPSGFSWTTGVDGWAGRRGRR
jgi:trehalose synthase